MGCFFLLKQIQTYETQLFFEQQTRKKKGSNHENYLNIYYFIYIKTSKNTND